MPRSNISEGIDLEQDLDGDSIRNLCLVGRNRLFAPGEHLYRQGEAARQVFVLLDGSVKATSSHAHGFDTLLKIHGPGSLLGLSALRRNGVRDANGIAVGETQVSSLSTELFLETLASNSALGVLLIRVLLKRQQQLHARIRNILGNNVEQRLAEVLLQLHAEVGVQAGADALPEISITHDDLASLVISRRQYVTQILGAFVDRKLITTGRKRIIILNPDGLRRVAEA